MDVAGPRSRKFRSVQTTSFSGVTSVNCGRRPSDPCEQSTVLPFARRTQDCQPTASTSSPEGLSGPPAGRSKIVVCAYRAGRSAAGAFPGSMGVVRGDDVLVVISDGVKTSYLWKEKETAYQGKITPDCKVKCTGCGASKLCEGGICHV